MNKDVQQERNTAKSGINYILSLTNNNSKKRTKDPLESNVTHYRHASEGIVMKYDISSESGYLHEPSTSDWYLFTMHQLGFRVYFKKRLFFVLLFAFCAVFVFFFCLKKNYIQNCVSKHTKYFSNRTGGW